MLLEITILLCTCSYSFSTTTLGVINNARFDASDALFFVANVLSVSDQQSCKCQCVASSMCITATYFGLTRLCSLFSAQLWQGKLAAVSTSQRTITITIQNKSVAVFGVNLVMNGDGEIGACAMAANVTHPTDWSYSGNVTQISYSNTVYGSQWYSTPGPSDRGNCYFVGQYEANTSMSQTVNLNVYAPDIDRNTVSFNLSAWMGGWSDQNDTAVVSLDFLNSLYQIVGNRTTIGPVLADDRRGATGLVFRQKTGLVPVTTRYLSVVVMLKSTSGSWNDGSVDNIRVELKQL